MRSRIKKIHMPVDKAVIAEAIDALNKMIKM